MPERIGIIRQIENLLQNAADKSRGLFEGREKSLANLEPDTAEQIPLEQLSIEIRQGVRPGPFPREWNPPI